MSAHRGPSSPGTAPIPTGGGHIGRCDFSRHAPINPFRILTASGSDADRSRDAVAQVCNEVFDEQVQQPGTGEGADQRSTEPRSTPIAPATSSSPMRR